MPEIDLSAQVRGFSGPAIDLAAIERDLTALWRMPTLAGLRQSEVVPTRTSVLNLVMIAGSKELARRGTRVIGQLATHHPSRAIIFATSTDPADFAGDIDARVSTHCYAGSGQHFAACFEQIEITVPRDALDYLTSLIMPLTLPDLPTYLWYPGQPPLADRRFARLARVADRLILDSLEFPRGGRFLARAAELARQDDGCPSLADLNWGRLIPWRRALAHFFDLPECRWALDHLVSARVELGASNTRRTEPNEAQGLLYLGWLMAQLGWQPLSAEAPEGGWRFLARDGRDQVVDLELTARLAPRTLDGALTAVRLEAQDGSRQARFELNRVGGDLATIRTVVSNGGRQSFEHAMQAPCLDTSKLLGRELEEPRRDELFVEALGEASRLLALRQKRSHA